MSFRMENKQGGNGKTGQVQGGRQEIGWAGGAGATQNVHWPWVRGDLRAGRHRAGATPTGDHVSEVWELPVEMALKPPCEHEAFYLGTTF